jgi:hypothetical protein
MNELAEWEIDDEDHDGNKVESEDPVDAWNPGMKMDEAEHKGLHIDDIGPEEKLKQNSADRDRQEEKEGEVVSKDRDEKDPFMDESSNKEESQGNGNEVARIEPDRLDPFHPARHRIEKIAKMPEKNDPEKKVE